jgi:hypothetical protein
MMSRHRVVAAIGISAVMVVLIAWLLPREYLANDDIGFTEYLRQNTFTPWISPPLVRAFCFAYQVASNVPWFGLYQYAVIFATGIALIHTCLELVDLRTLLGRAITCVGAVVVIASHAILVVGLTWTTVSISALGTALACFVAHVQNCQAAGSRISLARSLLYGLLFVSGYMLRLQGLGAIMVALAPLLAWAVWRCWRRRYLPSPTAVLAFVAPFAIVFVVQGRVPNARGDNWDAFKDWTNQRGWIHGHTAFEGLDTRAPELLKRAGWSVEEYRDFTSWLIIDEDQYPTEKIERLLNTGGAPEAISADWAYQQLHDIFEDSPASVMLFLTSIAAVVALAMRRLICRRSGLVFAFGYLVFLVGVPLWMSAHFRFPQRVSLSFYTVAALGVYVYLARAIGDRDGSARERDAIAQRTMVALAVVGVFLLVWARFFIGWLDRDIQPYRDARQQFEDRIAARGGFVFVYVQHGLVELDPLRARPRDYDGLEGGWGTFSFTWYETLAKLGVHRGSEALAKMLDNPDAYVVAQLYARDGLQDWIRRKLGNPDARLALVDSVAMPGFGRPQLYRIVTTPLRAGTEEWQALARDADTVASFLPGPPDVSDLPFRRVPLAAPFDQFVGPSRDPRATIAVTGAADGIRGQVIASSVQELCDRDDEDERGYAAGIRIPVHGLAAARFELRLADAENIVSVRAYAGTSTARSVRWRWELNADQRKFDSDATFTLVPGYPDHAFRMAADTADSAEVRELAIYVEVRPGRTAAFEVRNLEVAEP